VVIVQIAEDRFDDAERGSRALKLASAISASTPVSTR
jgi:hypothetical protein